MSGSVPGPLVGALCSDKMKRQVSRKLAQWQQHVARLIWDRFHGDINVINVNNPKVL